MKFPKTTEQNLLRKKVPLPFFLMISFLLIIALYFDLNPYRESISPVKKQETQSSSSRIVQQIRLNNYSFTKPLILTDVKDDLTEYGDLKGQLLNLVNEQTVAGDIESAGIYIRKLNGGSTISVNAEQSYAPGSLAKIIILMTYLKAAEKNPLILERSFTLTKGQYNPVEQSYPSQEIEINKKYSVKELLYFMIVKSANSATVLLKENIDKETFEKLFTDLGLPSASISTSNYQISANAVSRFLRVLYNSSYLTPEYSEIALNLLSQTEFNDGLLKSLPKSIKTVHKFGEQGDAQTKLLHETGIIYLDGNTYVITVMTKGKEMKNLSNFIAEVSKMVYNRFNTNI